MNMISQKIPLVLASGSPVRAQMLKSVGLQFSVVPSNVDEAAIKHSSGNVDPASLAAALARAKCLNVSTHYPGHLTIGADQVCALESQIFSKPVTVEKAAEQLMQLQGRTHHQHSAVCVARGDEIVFETVTSAALTMRALTYAQCVAYAQQERPLQACGSYLFEGMGRHLFERIEGDTDTILGLPLVPLLFTLHRLGAIHIG